LGTHGSFACSGFLLISTLSKGYAIGTESCALEVVQLAKRCDILIPMSEVKINPGDQFELALKRFNRKVQQDGILSEARRRAHYESPQARRKRKAAAQRRKQRRTRQPR
jgi:small subunit ribosomal protein S21